MDTCVSSIGGSKNWEDRTLGGYFGSPSMRDLCQVITVEPNVWLAGEMFQVRIRGGFPAHVDNLALTLTDAAGGEYDILAEAGPLTDWDTGEVLYSCEGEKLDDAQWGVVEEAPADSDRWRTIVARVTLPDEVEVGIATLGFNYPGADLMLSDCVKVIKVYFEACDGRKLNEIPLVNQAMLEEMVICETIAASFAGGAPLSDPFAVTLAFPADLSPDNVDTFHARLESNTSDIVVEYDVIETEETSLKFVSNDGALVIEMEALTAGLMETDTISVDIRAKAYGWSRIYERILCRQDGDQETVFVSSHFGARIEINPESPDTPLREDEVDSLRMWLKKDGEQVFYGTLTETEQDSMVFVDGSMLVSVVMLSEPTELEVDYLAIIVTSTSLGFSEDRVDLAETGADTLVFDTEYLATPSTGVLDDYVLWPNPPIDPQGFVNVVIEGLDSTGDETCALQVRSSTGILMDEGSVAMKEEASGTLKSAKPLILYEGRISERAFAYLSQSYCLVDPNGIGDRDTINIIHNGRVLGTRNVLTLKNTYEDGTERSYWDWILYEGDTESLLLELQSRKKNYVLQFDTIDASGNNTVLNAEKDPIIQYVSAPRPNDRTELVVVAARPGVARIFVKAVPAAGGAAVVLNSIRIVVPGGDARVWTLAQRIQGHRPVNPDNYDLTTVTGICQWTNALCGTRFRPEQIDYRPDMAGSPDVSYSGQTGMIRVYALDLAVEREQSLVLSSLIHEAWAFALMHETGNTTEGCLQKGDINGIHDIACIMEFFFQDNTGVPLDYWYYEKIVRQTESPPVNPLWLSRIYRHLYLPAVKAIFNQYKNGQRIEIVPGDMPIHHVKQHVPHGASELVYRIWKKQVSPIVIPEPKEE